MNRPEKPPIFQVAGEISLLYDYEAWTTGGWMQMTHAGAEVTGEDGTLLGEINHVIGGGVSVTICRDGKPVRTWNVTLMQLWAMAHKADEAYQEAVNSRAPR